MGGGVMVIGLGCRLGLVGGALGGGGRGWEYRGSIGLILLG